MRYVLLFLSLVVISQNSWANADLIKNIYQCTFEYGNVRYIKLADQEILIPQIYMPAPLSAIDDLDCQVRKGNKQRNGLILDQYSTIFLNRVSKNVTQMYNKACAGRPCSTNIDCKSYLHAITKAINSSLDEDLSNYGRLAETEMIFLRPVQNDKICAKKLESFYTSKRLLFYKKSSCFARIASKQDGYIAKLLLASEGKKWKEEFTNCIKQYQ